MSRLVTRRRVIWSLLLLALLALIAWVILRPAATPQGGRMHFGAGGFGPTPVVAAIAEKGAIPINFSALGTVTPLASVTVKTQIAGQLQQVAFQEGQIVKAGDFLAQIDPRPYLLSQQQYSGQLLRDQALLKEAELDLARYKLLVSQDSIARQQVDSQESLVQQYKGAIATDQAQIDNARLNLTYARITAPVGGRVGLRQVDPGNYVQTSDTNGLVVITQLEPISVIFTLPEDYLPQVMRRLKTGASLTVTAYDRALTSQLATGRLTTLDNQVDTTTGTVKLRAQFDNKDDLLFPNQFVNVVLNIDTLADAVIVPQAAVLKGAPGTFVYLVKPDNTVTVKTVTTGPSAGDKVAITAGLQAGDKVVVDGTDKLKEGAPITLPREKPAAGETPAGAAPAPDSHEGHRRHDGANGTGGGERRSPTP